ncbi:hypothetical protein SDC9_104951 [bioreactor metagenome]|uniref:Glycine zipper-like domain-containing protein n=1 Tax=bioreactor metagenome TaxID=1076179 RepID=A0A645AXX7_9ZZZZ
MSQDKDNYNKDITEKDDENQLNNKGTYLALGITFGAAFGVIFHNIAIGVSLGLIIGVAIDANIGSKNKK